MKKLLSIITIILILASCNKDKTTIAPQQTVNNTSCDTITCLLAKSQGYYKYTPQSSADTALGNVEIRVTLHRIVYDTLIPIYSPNRINYHYYTIYPQFNTNIVDMTKRTVGAQEGGFRYALTVYLKSGKQCVFIFNRYP